MLRLGRPDVSNAEIITAGYLKWGIGCLRYLEGDFAFVIWDPQDSQMFCARDRMGLKQLLYHYDSGKIFAFSTDAKAIFADTRITRQINKTRVLDFIIGSLEGVDKIVTPYEGVSRLQPGHYLRLKSGRMSIQSYWSLEPQEPSRLKTQADYIEAFKTHLKDSVARRIDNPITTGVMVSGGLDSSSIAAMGIDEFGPIIRSYSGINSANEKCVETKMIRAVNEHLGFNPVYMDLAKPAEWINGAKDGLSEILDPFDSNMTMLRGIYGAAQKNGLTVMLDGAYGDVVFSPGNHMRREMRRGRLTSAWQSLQAKTYGESGLYEMLWLYIKMLVSTLLPPSLTQKISDKKHARFTRHLLQSLGLREDIVRRHDLEGRLVTLRAHRGHDSWKNPYMEAVEIVDHPYNVVARERYDRVSSHFGIIARDPFSDVKLVKFCLSLPQFYKTHNGKTKSLLRKTMRNTLPDMVTERVSKEHLGFQFTQSLLRSLDSFVDGPDGRVLSQLFTTDNISWEQNIVQIGSNIGYNEREHIKYWANHWLCLENGKACG